LEDVNLNQLIKAIESNDLFKILLTTNSLSGIDLNKYDFKTEWQNLYTFSKLTIGELTFEKVNFLITPENISISILKNDSDLFDNSLKYVGLDGVTFEMEPYYIEGSPVKEFRKKLGSVEIFSRIGKLSVTKSTLYGSIIKLGFFN
jgi:hypothetical protein